MPTKNLNQRINDLLEQSQWDRARKLLQKELKRTPEDHWIVTQLGVTFYEQKQYEKALPIFIESRNIVNDCPLTLWNLAGTLYALGRHREAVNIYVWLLENKKSPEENPCWESKEWTDALKADCIFRLGDCFRGLGRKRKAENCYRQYLELLLNGIDGMYSIEEVKDAVRGLNGAGNGPSAERELRKAVNSTLREAGIKSSNGRKRLPPVVMV